MLMPIWTRRCDTYFCQIEELISEQKEIITKHDVEITTLNDSLKSQQADHESEIKLKAEAFTKVQDELQRLLTDTEKKLDQVWLQTNVLKFCLAIGIRPIIIVGLLTNAKQEAYQ